MNLRVLAPAAGLLGGLCWLTRWGAELTGADPGWGTGAHWAGLVLLGLAVAVVAAGLVSAAWLRVVVAVAAVLLAWSVYSVVGGGTGAATLDGVVGALAVLLAVAGWLVGRRGAPREDPRPRRRHHGAHSAR